MASGVNVFDSLDRAEADGTAPATPPRAAELGSLLYSKKRQVTQREVRNTDDTSVETSARSSCEEDDLQVALILCGMSRSKS